MDERIRAAERSGDRQRLLVELYRAKKPINWQKGDRVVCVVNGENSNNILLAGIYTGTIRGPSHWANPSDGFSVDLDTPLFFANGAPLTYMVFRNDELRPEGC